MATKLTVFYAWQSDRPLDFNKSLIWTALTDAAKRIHEDPNFGGAQVVIDADTKSVLGTPPVTDTILRKIAQADIFAPDLTFVATTEGGKLVPNPNVLIEWGYALKVLGFGAMLPVMNTHFGPPEDLPFDMGHIRHPLQYTIDPEAARDAERRATRSKLSETIEEILKEYVREHTERARKKTPFAAYQGVRAPAFFFPTEHPLVTFEPGDPPLTYKSLKGLYMRLYPTYGGQPRVGNTGARDIIRKLKPMAEQINPYSEGNEFGAITVDTDGVRIEALTQVFASGELWGISTKPFRSGQPELVVAVNVEKTLTQTLHNYLQVVKNDLKLTPPFTLELGLTGLKGVVLLYPGREGFSGGQRSKPFARDTFDQSYQLDGFGWPEWQDALRTFFIEFYDVVGLRRDDVMRPENIAASSLPPL